MSQRLVRFGMVGVVGYLVDTGTLLVLVQLAALPPFSARILSFVTAASATYFLNQRFTFSSAGNSSLRRWSYYLATTAFGAALNVGLYQMWIARTDASPLNLALGTAIGSLVAMVVNYTVSSRLVFRTA